MLTTKTILLILFCVQLLTAHAQVLPFHRYNAQNGLPVDRVNTIAQDEQGFMWFGSPFGLIRYDGIHFENIALPREVQNKPASSILAVDNRIYAGFMYGGGLVEYCKGKTKVYHVSGKDSLRFVDVRALAENGDGSILVATSGEELFLFKNGTFRHYLSFSKYGSISCLLKDNYDNLWIGTGDGLFIVQGKNKAVIKLLPGYDIFSLQKDKREKICIGAYNGKVSVHYCRGVDGDKLKDVQTIICPEHTHALPSNGNLDNGFWGINTKKGIFNIDPDGQLKFYQLNANTDADFVYFFCDREKNVWVSSSPGVVKLSNFSSTTFYFDELANGGGFVMRSDTSTIWTSNVKNVYRIQNGKWQKLQKPERYRNEYINVLLADSKGNIWVTSPGKDLLKTVLKGNKLILKKAFTTFRNKKIEGPELAEDNQGNMWLASFGGVFRIKNDMVQENLRPVFDSGDSLYCINIEIDTIRQILWLGDLSKGIFKVEYKIRPNGTYAYKVLASIGKKQGLDDTFIRSMLLDKNGTLWVGTRFGGLYKITEERAGQINTRKYGTEHGLNCTRIGSIVQGSRNILLGTCNGLYAFDEKQERFHQYSTGKGLLNAEVYSIVSEGENEIWALTMEGVTKFKLLEDINPVLPSVAFTAITILGKKDTAALYTPTLRLPYRHNSIGFVFTANSFIDERKVLYRYKLEGYDKDWSIPSANNTVQYTLLPAGDYNFKIMASNAYGVWSNEPTVYHFRIDQPLYQKGWFIILCLLLPVIIFFSIRTMQLRQKIALERLRLQIARDLHDDIGSALGSVNILNQTAQRRLENTPAATHLHDLLQRISLLVQQTLDSMDDIIWTINPTKEKFEDLVLRMKEFALPLCESRGIVFQLHSALPDSEPMNLIMKKNVFLIYKEAITNALKHAQCNYLTLETGIRNTFFYLKITDDGKGFDCTKTTNRNGLKNMQKRAEETGGTLTIKTHADEGTMVELNCPIR